MNVTDNITITNEDNMELMARYPDNYFELAIVDPPYGINVNMNAGRKKDTKSKKRIIKKWDSEAPTKEYFNELFRVSKNQIIWGANHMTDKIQINSQGWIFWDKCVAEGCSFSDGELAFTSFNQALKKAIIPYSGFIGMEGEKFHPTTKPIKLYKWILDKYAKQGDKILDTHLGSGSIAIACHDYGFDLTACELDKEYFDKAMQRINNHVSQQKLF
jgi:site-specific DNA-methyltransferase (adenine-specific)